MKRLIVACMAVAVLAAFSFVAVAQDATNAPAPAKMMKAAPEMVKVELVGKLMKTEAGKFVLATKEGKVHLPEVKAVEGEKAIDLASMVGKEVTVAGMGYTHEKTMADGSKVKMSNLKTITSVTEAPAADAKAAAPVAPAAAPAAPAAPAK